MKASFGEFQSSAPLFCQDCPNTGGCFGRCQKERRYEVVPPSLGSQSERRGWICPKCDAALSPDIDRCPCSSRVEFVKGLSVSPAN